MSGAAIPAAVPPPVPAWRRFALPAFALLLAGALVVATPLQWSSWTGGARWQGTDDASLRGDLTPLSARVGGYVRRAPASDYAQVREGDLLVELVDDEYRAQLAQAEANVEGATAAIDNNLATQALQGATVRAAQAAVVATRADLVRYQLEAKRQHTLVATQASPRQAVEQADANASRTGAMVDQGEAQVEASQRQLGVLKTQAKQLAATLAAQRALLDLARLNLGYTRITAPANGRVGERMVRPGQLVAAGTQVITVVPEPGLWVIANYKETQLTNVRSGQAAEITVDALPGQRWRGRVETVAPASGSQFALLPPDNATGNFTKVVQRVPVKILLDRDNPPLDRLRPGLSVTAWIDTRAGAP